MEAMLKKEEAKEEGRVKKNMKKKKGFSLVPHWGPGASLGRKNRIAHQTCTIGAMGAM